MVLTRSRARSYYDRIGSLQDTQAFYEDSALDDLIAHAALESAEKVFEFGCGTGRFAARLLAERLPPSASYLGIDQSSTMIDIAGRRIASYGGRAKVVLSGGSMRFPLADGSIDRVVSTYVLDLLSREDALEAVSEAHRILLPGGRLCLVSLTTGTTFPSRLVSSLWSLIFRLHAPLVGGCRPIHLGSFLEKAEWSISYRNVVRRFGIASEVLIAEPKSRRI